MSITKFASFALLAGLTLTVATMNAAETKPAAPAVGAAPKAPPAPNIIPAPQEWTPAKGTFDLAAATITCPTEQTGALKPILEQLRRDLVTTGATQRKLAVTTFEQLKKAKDKTPSLFFAVLPARGQFGKTGGPNPEGYTIAIQPGKIIVTAPTPTGIFYATQSLLQMAMQSPKLPCGTITDWPSYRVRSLMLDVGRKFFPFDTVKQYIRLMGFLKMNELHLHISDNSFGAETYPGFRIECTTMPQLTSTDGHYTKAQIREMQDFARARGVSVVPEIDAPGHAFCFTRLRPDLRHPKLGESYLDVLNPKTTVMMKTIFDEFIPLFDHPHVHIGTDEYRRGKANKEEWAALGEGFRQYINTMNKYIRAKHGKTVRIWSGWEHMPGTTQPDKNIIIDMWVSSDAKKKSALGYKYINSNHGRTYIVPGAGYYGVSNTGLYGNWTPAVFTGKADKDPVATDPNLLGGKLHVWNDMGPNGYTMYEIADLTVPTLYVMSEKMWGTKASADYAAFTARVAKLMAVPNVQLLTRRVKPVDVKTGVVFDSGDKVYTLKSPADSIPLMPYINTGGDEQKNLEFPFTVSMQIKPAAGVTQIAPAAILGSRIAELQADLQFSVSKRDRKTKKTTVTKFAGLGISRLDKYSSNPLRNPKSGVSRGVSNVTLPAGEFSTLTVVGTRRNTTFYIDGRQIASFSGSKQQMLCPLETVGALPGRGGSFVGEIKNIKIYNTAADKYTVAKLAGFPLPVNIALGCKAVATRSDTPYKLTPEKLTDGNTSSRTSRWSTGQTKAPASVTVDLGTLRSVNGINLHWESAHPKDYTVEMSGDGKTFIPVLSAKGKPGLATIKMAPTKTRFVRITMKNPATVWGYCLYEIEIFGK